MPVCHVIETLMSAIENCLLRLLSKAFQKVFPLVYGAAQACLRVPDGLW